MTGILKKFCAYLVGLPFSKKTCVEANNENDTNLVCLKCQCMIEDEQKTCCTQILFSNMQIILFSLKSKHIKECNACHQLFHEKCISNQQFIYNKGKINVGSFNCEKCIQSNLDKQYNSKVQKPQKGNQIQANIEISDDDTQSQNSLLYNEEYNNNLITLSKNSGQNKRIKEKFIEDGETAGKLPKCRKRKKIHQDLRTQFIRDGITNDTEEDQILKCMIKNSTSNLDPLLNQTMHQPVTPTLRSQNGHIALRNDQGSGQAKEDNIILMSKSEFIKSQQAHAQSSRISMNEIQNKEFKQKVSDVQNIKYARKKIKLTEKNQQNAVLLLMQSKSSRKEREILLSRQLEQDKINMLQAIKKPSSTEEHPKPQPKTQTYNSRPIAAITHKRTQFATIQRQRQQIRQQFNHNQSQYHSNCKDKNSSQQAIQKDCNKGPGPIILDWKHKLHMDSSYVIDKIRWKDELLECFQTCASQDEYVQNQAYTQTQTYIDLLDKTTK